MHRNLAKIERVVPEISSRTDRQTDILITILRNCSEAEVTTSHSTTATVAVGHFHLTCLSYETITMVSLGKHS